MVCEAGINTYIHHHHHFCDAHAHARIDRPSYPLSLLFFIFKNQITGSAVAHAHVRLKVGTGPFSSIA